MSNLVDALDFLKSYRKLDSEKVVSLPIESKNYNRVKRQFKNIRLEDRISTSQLDQDQANHGIPQNSCFGKLLADLF